MTTTMIEMLDIADRIARSIKAAYGADYSAKVWHKESKEVVRVYIKRGRGKTDCGYITVTADAIDLDGIGVCHGVGSDRKEQMLYRGALEAL